MTALLNLLPLGVSLLTAISQAWGSATGSSLQKVQSVISQESAPILNVLSAIGNLWFPSLEPSLHAAAVALLAAEQHTGAAAWVQAALNIAETATIVSFGPQLAVDGIWGPKSMAALKAFQATLKIPTTGMFADAEVAALQALLAKE